jgi:hypothetical protein
MVLDNHIVAGQEHLSVHQHSLTINRRESAGLGAPGIRGPFALVDVGDRTACAIGLAEAMRHGGVQVMVTDATADRAAVDSSCRGVAPEIM